MCCPSCTSSCQCAVATPKFRMLCILRATLLSDRSQLRVVTVSKCGEESAAIRAHLLWLWGLGDLNVVWLYLHLLKSAGGSLGHAESGFL